ncbi:uncharacterized protein LOC130641047 isoform X1 [Hydractinia symbiolongicarpus]|uniref:uncharacterized protein LOC130641047 isoform X1 n=1 Tax=Hydractinia symbiolongicarpus TaxID=13093 RepID=UPI002551B192|nr:uncharacterized protein LOC130641047 isoform X1 [Hydractinia symbiolongicarpus]XP_057303667.1 uncharacterized protein LOC130641047 isoform X1 [Hydractinia symbiolongicarpus]XP_057303668.1 uncharacterized protein LOC130641047 isoform X1 [Hydractinia symbiolongicarpus]XP_057303669.1 uncharacterized protein LOC130641047 isoform X1 [Hydractinia symbiolongicarpus]
MQRLNDGLQKDVSAVKKQITDGEKQRENHMNVIQSRYDELADNFRNAMKYYVDPVLSTEEGMWKVSCEAKKNEITNEEDTLSKMMERLEKLKIIKGVPEEKPPKSIWRQYLDAENTALTLFQRENQLADTAVKELYNALQSEDKNVHEIEESLFQLKNHKTF